MCRKLSDLVKKMKLTHWTDLVFGLGGANSAFLKDPVLGGSLPAYVVLHGASLYVRRAIEEEPSTLSIEKAEDLLCYAIPPFDWHANIFGSRMSRMVNDSFFKKIFNVEAAVLLLSHGADPVRGPFSRSPWQNCISWMRPQRLTAIREPDSLFRLMQLLVKHTSDHAKLRTIEHEGLTACKAIRTQALENECCPGKCIKLCSCPKARELVRLAHELLTLIEQPT